jgi:hypothetical protein
MKKSELQKLIKQEIRNILNEGGPFDAFGSPYGAFQTPKPISNPPKKLDKGWVITNGKEWYAGAKNYLAFAKTSKESNVYPTYSSAKIAFLTEIPESTIKEKQLKIIEYK